MATEKTYIINLRREWLKAPKYKRAKKAIAGLKTFIARHMKQRDPEMIRIGENLNMAIWARGMQSPPHKIKVTITKDDEGMVKAELFGFKYVEKKKAEKKEDEGMLGKLKEKLGGKEVKAGKEEEAEEETEKPKEKKEKPAEKKEAKKDHAAEKKPAKKEEHKKK